jgi:hypothetical protein
MRPAASRKCVPMLDDFSPKVLAGSWFMAVIVVVASAVAVGVKVDPTATLWLLALSLIPPATILLVMDHGASLSPQVIHAGDPQDNTPRL